jgi:L-lactate dehydrogenase complex protein LldG
MDARDEIISSIRSHLALSESYDQQEAKLKHEQGLPVASQVNVNGASLVDLFKESLEAVDGHCVVVNGEAEVVGALAEIISHLQRTPLVAEKIALSNVGWVERLVRQVPCEVEELAISPSAADVFHFDVGITTAQAAIAETGTLVLDATQERHRVVSLVPPVHVAIIESRQIYRTLGETLAIFHSPGTKVSRSLTFITGPSRTADIELTLTIGVHGPQELYVIVNTGERLS